MVGIGGAGLAEADPHEPVALGGVDVRQMGARVAAGTSVGRPKARATQRPPSPNVQPWYGQTRQPSCTVPIDSGASRCGHRSGAAATAPSAERQITYVRAEQRHGRRCRPRDRPIGRPRTSGRGSRALPDSVPGRWSPAVRRVARRSSTRVDASATVPTMADLLVRGRDVVTMDANRRIVRDGAVAVAGTTIVAVGPFGELRGRASAGRRPR